MPTVPRYDSQKIRTEALPGVSLRGAPEFAEIKGLEAFNNEMQRTGEKIAKAQRELQQEEKKKTDQLDLTTADRKASELQTRLQVETSKKLGRDAGEAPDLASSEWNKGITEIEDEMTSEEARAAFRASASNRWESLNKHVQFHLAEQTKKVDESETAAYIQTSRDAAKLNSFDDNAIGLEVARTRAVIDDWGTRNGLTGTETLRVKVLDEVSATHRSVIESRTAAGKDVLAKSYFEQAKAKGELSEKDLKALEGTLKESSVRAESQRQADGIWVKSKGNLGDALRESGKLTGELRDMTESRLRQKQSDLNLLESQVQKNLYLNATNLIDKAPPGSNPRDIVPAKDWAQLSLEHRNALENRAGDPANDDKLWLDFLAKSPSDIRQINRADFEVKYWSKFDKAHRTRAEAMWNDANEGKGSSDSDKLTASITFKDRVDNTLRIAGLIRANKTTAEFSGEEARVYAQFEAAAAQKLEAFERGQLGAKRKATGDEIQAILDDLISKKVYVNEWGRDPKKPTFALSPEEMDKAYVEYGDIPLADRSKIQEALKLKGRPVSEQAVIELYMKGLKKRGMRGQ